MVKGLPLEKERRNQAVETGEFFFGEGKAGSGLGL